MSETSIEQKSCRNLSVPVTDLSATSLQLVCDLLKKVEILLGEFVLSMFEVAVIQHRFDGLKPPKTPP